MQKIKNIEFLRTFLMLSIVLHHMFITRDWCLCSIFPNIYLYSFIKSFIAFSYNSVEGFFIIAGFLLFLTFKNSIKVVDFIKKKYIRLTPVIVFSFILCLVAKIFQNNYTKIQNFTPSKLKKILITFAEILSSVFVFWWLCFPHLKYNNIFFVIGFAVLFSLFIFKKGYLSNILDKDFWVFLGRYQYSMYVVHYVIIKIFGIVLWQKNVGWVVLHPVLPIVIMLLIILAVTIFAYHFVEIPCAKYLKDKLFCRTIVQGENK